MSDPEEEVVIYDQPIEHDGDLIEEAKLPRDTPKNLRGRSQLRMFDEYPKVTTHRGPSRDRSLRGKARRKARKAG